MAERKALSKKIRFDVFKRDMFCCQYCGKTPPMVILEVDHIIPVSKNGKDEIDNLITACFDCNRGKGADELKTLPKQTGEKLSILKERELQYKAYQKLLLSIDKRLNGEIEIINTLFTSYFPDKELTETFKSSIKIFIKKLGLKNVCDAMDRAAAKIQNSSKETLIYFCGICWNMIKKNRKHIDDRGEDSNV